MKTITKKEVKKFLKSFKEILGISYKEILAEAMEEFISKLPYSLRKKIRNPLKK